MLQERLFLVQFRGMQAAESSWQSEGELNDPSIIEEWLAKELPTNFYEVCCRACMEHPDVDSILALRVCVCF